ncbi:MAG TPA: hemerythrin domain-containing protein [Minicystis sp.]|nr:hemerythrin domain-containing protein [Minicystis sp.]
MTTTTTTTGSGTTANTASARPIRDLLEADHARLEALLARVVLPDGGVDAEAFTAFRKDLARHIGMEEKILFPAVKAAVGDAEQATLARLRADHGKLVAMLVRSPTPERVAAIQALLAPHDALEEGPEGVYARCEAILAGDVHRIREALEHAPEVPMRPAYDGPWPAR